MVVLSAFMTMHYYQLLGGPLLDKFMEWKEERSKQFLERKAFAMEFSADGMYGSDTQLNGLIFREGSEIPKGWIVASHSDGAYKPTKRSKAGKETIARMEALPMNGARQLQEALGLPGLMVHEAVIHHMSAVWVRKDGGDPTSDDFVDNHNILLGIPDIPDIKRYWRKAIEGDDQVKALKKSEYYALQGE